MEWNPERTGELTGARRSSKHHGQVSGANLGVMVSQAGQEGEVGGEE